MSGLSPPPTKIRVQGNPEYLSGRIELINGLFIDIEQVNAAKTFEFIHRRVDDPRGLDVFANGATSARTLQRIRGLVDPVITSVDVFLQTAPAGNVGALNFDAVRVAGSDSGQVDLALDAAAQAFHLGVGDLTSILGSNAHSVNSAIQRGWASRFTPTADLTLGGISFECNALPIGGPMRAGLASDFAVADGITIDTVPWLEDSLGNNVFRDIASVDVIVNDWTDIIFDRTLDLISGTNYRFVAINLSQQRSRLDHSNVTTGNITATPVSLIRIDGDGQAVSNAVFDVESAVDNQRIAMRLLGDAIGTLLTGNEVIVSFVRTGVPDTPGQNAMIAIAL